MDNSYFIYSNSGPKIKIKRFHVCTWEFRDNTAFIEVGLEVTADSVADKDTLELELFVPWFKKGCIARDFYSKLKEPYNSKFIFNDSISETRSLDGGDNLMGVVHKFTDRDDLCILPIEIAPIHHKNRIAIKVDLINYKRSSGKPNIYIRFSINPNKLISTRKKGIARSTILYDIKINQKRNIPESLSKEFSQKMLCEIDTCFCFNIIPNSYDLAFFENSSLENVRTLEFSSFSRYIEDQRIKKDDLIVVFNKKNGLDSYAFFSIYSTEHIGANQFALALLVSLIAGILLFIPSYTISLPKHLQAEPFWSQMPIMFWVVVLLVLIMMFFIALPRFGFSSMRPPIKVTKKQR